MSISTRHNVRLCTEGLIALCSHNLLSIDTSQSPHSILCTGVADKTSTLKEAGLISSFSFCCEKHPSTCTYLPERSSPHSPKMILSHLFMVGALAADVQFRRQQRAGSCSSPSTPFCCTREKVEPDVESSSSDPYYSYACELTKPTNLRRTRAQYSHTGTQTAQGLLGESCPGGTSLYCCTSTFDGVAYVRCIPT